jgi:hypothetical protein
VKLAPATSCHPSASKTVFTLSTLIAKLTAVLRVIAIELSLMIEHESAERGAAGI